MLRIGMNLCLQSNQPYWTFLIPYSRFLASMEGYTYKLNEEFDVLLPSLESEAICEAECRRSKDCIVYTYEINPGKDKKF